MIMKNISKIGNEHEYFLQNSGIDSNYDNDKTSFRKQVSIFFNNIYTKKS